MRKCKIKNDTCTGESLDDRALGNVLLKTKDIFCRYLKDLYDTRIKCIMLTTLCEIAVVAGARRTVIMTSGEASDSGNEH